MEKLFELACKFGIKNFYSRMTDCYFNIAGNSNVDLSYRFEAVEKILKFSEHFRKWAMDGYLSIANDSTLTQEQRCTARNKACAIASEFNIKGFKVKLGNVRSSIENDKKIN